MGLFVVFAIWLLMVAMNFSYLSSTGLLVLNLKSAKIFSKDLHKSVQTDKILSNKECLYWSNRVRQMKDKWNKRNVSMNTLGSASYLDLNHEELSFESNQLLKPFDLLNEKVRSYLESKLKQKVVFRDGCCKPGFHIFECNSIFSYPVASVHKDMQYQRLKYYEDEEIDTDNLLSFTLPIELPKKAGLFLFDTEVPAWSMYFFPKILWFNFCNKVYVPYKEGEIVMHKGLDFHMIGPSEINTEKYRMTLQGHGVFDRKNKVWHLYW